jgi:lipoate-protein ligase A
MEKMSGYLNVSHEKLESKGVKSVKSRVTNLIDYCPTVTPELMKEKLLLAFAEVYGTAPKELDGDSVDKQRISELTQTFSSWDWIFGKKIAFTFDAEQRFPWGNIQMQLQFDKGMIEQSVVYSDAMNEDLISKIQFTGCPFSSKEMINRVRSLLENQADSTACVIDDICGFILEQNI